MPSISTMLYPIPAYVRVEVNWADFGQATGAAVYRVDCLTGERVPLRPYVSFDGDFIDLSCGYAIFWDTEPQLDRCVYYCTQAIDASGDPVTTPASAPMAYTFSTAVVNGWGPTDTGQVVTLTGGTVPGDYDVAAGFGTQTHTAVNVEHVSSVDTGVINQDLYVDSMIPYGSALTAGISAQLWGRMVDTNNKYGLDTTLDTAGTLTMQAFKIDGGAFTALGGSVVLATGHVNSTWYTLRLQVWGNQVRAKGWLRTTPEPVAWQVDVVDSSPLTEGTLSAVRTNLAPGNTNTLPAVFGWDNWFVYEPCAEATTVELCSDDLVVPSSGDFRFGDPVRPCNDVTLQLVGEIDPACVPTQGIFFGNMADEAYDSNTGNLLPVNDSYPIVVSRARRAVTSTLTVATRTFADRDAMLQLLAPGSPQLLRGPAQYGIPDRYMSVGPVTVGRHLSDHRIEPRSVEMPHAAVRRPSGPSQGVCGARVEDLCDTYDTWDEIVAAGFTYADLLRGAASSDTPLPVTDARTWDDVDTEFTDWDDLEASEPDWNSTLAGD